MEQSSFQKLLGTTAGNYRLEQLVERDSAGPIFIARNTTTNGVARLRILALSEEQTGEARIIFLGRFQQEANLIARLRHPHILPLPDYGNHEGMPYLAWSYNAQMQSLYAYIAGQGPLDTLTVSRCLDQIASALEYAYQNAALHRSLTTRCIFLLPGTSPRQAMLAVADFGVLHMLEQGLQGSQKDMALFIAEYEGCAPEQLLAKPIDVSTDVYALGAVLYRLLTGRRVFSGKTRDEVIQHILHSPVPSLSAWRGDFPPGLDEIVARALAKDPAKRYRSPGELANAYHQLVAPRDNARPALAIPAPLPSSAPVSIPARSPVLPTRQSRPTSISRRRVLVVGGVSAVAVVAVAAYGVHLLTGAPPSAPVAANTPAAQNGGSGPTTATSPAQSHNGTVIAHTADVPANSAKTFSLANASNPGILVHLAGGNTFVAFDSTCTHAGCAVNYSQQDKLLECPCHQAAFDPAKNAAVVRGPATTPLKAVAITVNADGTITTG